MTKISMKQIGELQTGDRLRLVTDDGEETVEVASVTKTPTRFGNAASPYALLVQFTDGRAVLSNDRAEQVRVIER